MHINLNGMKTYQECLVLFSIHYEISDSFCLRLGKSSSSTVYIAEEYIYTCIFVYIYINISYTNDGIQESILSILPAWIFTSTLSTPFISPISVKIHTNTTTTHVFTSILTPVSVNISSVLIPEWFKTIIGKLMIQFYIIYMTLSKSVRSMKWIRDTREN